MRGAQRGHGLVVPLDREARLEPQLWDALLHAALAHGGLRFLGAEERARPFGVPRAALVGADPAGADREQRVADLVERLERDEHDELPVHGLPTVSAG